MELRDRRQAGEVYTIRQVAEMTDVPENTIRSWERRFGIPQPTRTGSNQRRYTELDAFAIRSIQASRDRGRSMEQAIDDLGRPERPDAEHGPQPVATPQTDHDASRDIDQPDKADAALIASLIAFDGERAREIVAERRWNASTEAVCLDLLLPALRTIDEQWAEGRLAEIQARFGREWIRRKLEFALNESSPELGRLNILVAAMLDDSARDEGVCLSIILSRAGYRVVWVSSDATVAGLDVAISLRPPSAMVLATRSELSIVAARAAVEHLAKTRQRGAWQGLIAVTGGEPGTSEAISLPLHATQTVATLERALNSNESTLRIVRNR